MKKKKNLRYFVIGDWLKSEMITNQAPWLFFVAFLIIVFISNNYAAQRQQQQIHILNDSLKILEHQNILLTKELTPSQRQSSIELLLEEKEIRLVVPQQPAFEIKK